MEASCSLFGDAAQYHNLICNARLLSYFFPQSVTERTASMLHSKLMSWQIIQEQSKVHPKGQKKSKWFFQADVSSKKRMNKFYFTTMKLQVDLFSFVFLRKLKTPKRHFEINWPLSFSYQIPTHANDHLRHRVYQLVLKAAL